MIKIRGPKCLYYVHFLSLVSVKINYINFFLITSRGPFGWVNFRGMEKGREKKEGNKFIGVESEHKRLVVMFC